ncbi:MAG TPA: class I SAM-dependent methyltransferase [Sedimentisphaerales bacterium]|nr:class I SAM-dependent methyltransferase [Sedimentisphaerales bacterium]
MKAPHVVRGYGPLDLFLAKQRCKAAKRQIKLAGKHGRILDIGCGAYPLFLVTIDFSEKYGLDKIAQNDHVSKVKERGITLVSCEIEKEERIPFENDYFDVVSMLAVFEHIEVERLVKIHKEIYRILKPGGMYIMTTPAFWSGRLLRFLAKIRLISEVEIKEHKGSYNFSKISSVLQQACFEKDRLRFGYFEIFMNTWVTATK